MPPRALSLLVVGADYPNKRGPTRLFEIAMCRPGDRVHLVPEPKNTKDPHAMMVMSERGVQMGYVKAERAPWIGTLMARGHELTAIFQQATKGGAIVRLGIDCVPDLPAPGALALDAPRRSAIFNDELSQDDGSDGFYPDEVPADE